MNIIVCIKQVPDTQEVRLDPVTHTLKREGVKAIINPFDLYALEEGLRVKDSQGGRVTMLTMGPPQAEEALREAMGYGADGAVLLSDPKFAGADTWATALTLARAIGKMGGADLIFTGKQAIDGDTAQVGPMLAAILKIPYASWARKLSFLDDGALRVERLLDHGYDAVEVKLPALITVVKEINEPRLVSFNRGQRRPANSPGSPVQISAAPRAGGGKTFTTWVKEPARPTCSGLRSRSARPHTGMASFLALNLALKEGSRGSLISLTTVIRAGSLTSTAS